MKACGNDANPADDLTPLGENTLEIRKELRTLRNSLPQTEKQIAALEERLRTEFLPRVTELCRGAKSGVAFAHILAGAIHSELRQHRESQAAYLRADQLRPGDLSILNGLCSSAVESGDLSEAKRAAKLITADDEKRLRAMARSITTSAAETKAARAARVARTSQRDILNTALELFYDDFAAGIGLVLEGDELARLQALGLVPRRTERRASSEEKKPVAGGGSGSAGGTGAGSGAAAGGSAPAPSEKAAVTA